MRTRFVIFALSRNELIVDGVEYLWSKVMCVFVFNPYKMCWCWSIWFHYTYELRFSRDAGKCFRFTRIQQTRNENEKNKNGINNNNVIIDSPHDWQSPYRSILSQMHSCMHRNVRRRHHRVRGECAVLCLLCCMHAWCNLLKYNYYVFCILYGRLRLCEQRIYSQWMARKTRFIWIARLTI